MTTFPESFFGALSASVMEVEPNSVPYQRILFMLIKNPMENVQGDS